MGLFAAAGIAICIVRGGGDAFRWAFVLMFVPTRYMYPSQKGWLNKITLLVGAAWCIELVPILFHMPDDETQLVSSHINPVLVPALVSLYFPLYYLIVSWGLGYWLRRPR